MHLTGATAGLAVFRIGSGSSTNTFTVLARFESRNAQLRRHAVRCFLECYFQVITQISPTLCRRPARSRASAAEHITKTEQITKNVFYSAEAGCAPAGAGTARDTSVSKAIITSPLLGIR